MSNKESSKKTGGKGDGHTVLDEGLIGKKVAIEALSLYDQVSNETVIVEYFEGTVVSIGELGIHLENTVRKRYVNGKYEGDLRVFSKKCIVYHRIINHIFVKE